MNAHKRYVESIVVVGGGVLSPRRGEESDCRVTYTKIIKMSSFQQTCTRSAKKQKVWPIHRINF